MKKIFLLALIIRFISLFLFRNVTNYDLQSYLQVGQLTLKGINIYPTIANLHHPYLPFFLYLEAMAYRLGEMGGIRGMGVIIIKTLAITFDLAILYLVYKLSKKNLRTAFLYAINPVTILITTLHGQFDVIPLFFILLSIYLLTKKKEFKAILSFSLAIMVKTWPLLFLVFFFKRLKKRRLIILASIFPLLSIIVYSLLFEAAVLDVLKTVANYQGLWGIWGLWPAFAKATAGKGIFRVFWQKLTTLIFLISFFGYSYFNNRKNLIKEIISLLFFFFVFTTNFSIQYFSWLMPFLILAKPKKFFRIIILITFYLFSFYYFLLFCYQCKTTPQWLLTSQNLIGFFLWLFFIRSWYLSKKIS